jgi:hypothetical protein
VADSLAAEQVIARAREAERILKSDLVVGAFERLEADIVDAWVNIPIRDKDGANELSRLIKTARKFKNIFTVYLDDGKYTAQQLADAEREKETIPERVRRVFG